jgi:hypothetical protein
MSNARYILPPQRPLPRRTLAGRRAFTLMELVLGMLITALVMSALAALLGAVAQGWKQSGEAQATSNVITQTHVRIQRLLKSVRLIGACRPGALDGTAAEQAAVLLWTADHNHDYRIQLSELALLECEMGGAAADCTLKYRTVAYPASWTAAEKAAEDGAPITMAELNDEASIEWFRDIVATSTFGKTTLVARNIVGSEFRRLDGATATRPSFHYLLNIQRGNAAETEYGTVAVRTPTTYPS